VAAVVYQKRRGFDKKKVGDFLIPNWKMPYKPGNQGEIFLQFARKIAPGMCA
jgi:hypothetical protein